MGFFAQWFLTATGVKAYPQAPAPSAYINLYHMGQHLDNSTGTVFDLFVEDESMDPLSAFNVYLGGCNKSSISKRNWFDCQFPGKGIKELGCNSAHALGNFVSATGSVAMGGYISSLMKEAFSGGRDGQSPIGVPHARWQQPVLILGDVQHGGPPAGRGSSYHRLLGVMRAVWWQLGIQDHHERRGDTVHLRQQPAHRVRKQRLLAVRALERCDGLAGLRSCQDSTRRASDHDLVLGDAALDGMREKRWDHGGYTYHGGGRSGIALRKGYLRCSPSVQGFIRAHFSLVATQLETICLALQQARTNEHVANHFCMAFLEPLLPLERLRANWMRAQQLVFLTDVP